MPEIAAERVSQPDAIGLRPGLVEAVCLADASEIFGINLAVRRQFGQRDRERRAGHIADQREYQERDQQQRQRAKNQAAEDIRGHAGSVLDLVNAVYAGAVMVWTARAEVISAQLLIEGVE